MAGGVPVFVKCPIEADLKMTPDQLEAAITSRTKWLILNSPSNPGGVGYDVADLAGFAEVLRRHPQVNLISDDIYEHLV